MTMFILTTMIDFVVKSLTANIETRITESLLLFGILSAIGIMTSFVNTIMMTKISKTSVLDFEHQQFKKYASMDRQSKEKSTMSAFREKLNRAGWAISNRYKWGVGVCISLSSSFVGFVFIVVTHRQYFILLMFISVHIGWYLSLTKNMIVTIDARRTVNRKRRSCLSDLSNLLATRLHNGESSCNELMAKKEEIMTIQTTLDDYWSFVTSCQSLPNYIVVILIALCVNPSLYLVLYIICNNLNNSINNALHFANQYKTQANDLKDLAEFWEDKTFDTEYPQHLIPCTISLSGRANNFLSIGDNDSIDKSIPRIVNPGDNNLIPLIVNEGNNNRVPLIVNEGNNNRVPLIVNEGNNNRVPLIVNEGNNNRVPLIVNQGDKIIISGASGSGKTTLIKAMQGHVKGLEYTTQIHPLSYRDSIMYMCQNARETVPTSRTTLRELFYDETNSQLILDALHIVQLTQWFNTTIRTLDIVIEERISGGQKTRLCLGIILYKARKNNVQWLILDEPDSGLDPMLSPQLLKDVIGGFPDVTIFLIVHLCECQLKTLGIKKHWVVENQMVRCIEQ
jgi:ABC-type multidrug transport system fused ATPase/permease subunit